jgi:hypothetical protein
LAKAINLCAIPPLFISSPDKIKKGMANNAKLSRPVAMRWDTVVKAGITGILTNMVSREDMAMLHATGVPMDNKQIKLMTKTRIGTCSIMTIAFLNPIFYNT